MSTAPGAGHALVTADPRVARRRLERPAVAARAVTLLVFVTQALLFASWTAHIPLVKSRLGLTDAELGLTLFGAPIGSVLATLATSWLLPRVGSRRMVQLCLAGYCATGWTVGVASSSLELFGALALWGVFQGALDVSMNAQAVFVEQRAGKPHMSGFHAAWSLGSFAGAALGAIAVAAAVPLPLQLVVLGTLIAIVVGPASRALLPDPPVGHHGGERPSVMAVWRHPTVIVLGAIALACMLVEGAVADWSAVYLHDSLGASPGVAGLAYAAYAAAMVAQRLVGDRLLARVGARVLLPALATVATIGMAVALVAGNPAVSIVGFAVLAVGVALVIPAAFTAAGRVPGVHPGSSVAAVSAIGWVGFVAGPPVIGSLADAVSLPVALALLPILTGVVAVSVRVTRGFADSPHAPRGAR